MRRTVVTMAMSLLMALAAIATTTTPLDRAMRSLGDISSLIDEQEHNIVQLQAQLEGLARQQRLVTDTITHHKWQLAQLRSQYAQVVRNLHAHSTAIDRLVYIFSAGSVSQAWQRATYLRQLSQWREQRSQLLAQSLERLGRQQAALSRVKSTRRAALNACIGTRAALQSRLDEAAALVVELRAQAPQLQAVLAEKRQRAQQLGQSLDGILTQQSASAPDEAVTSLQPASLPWPVTGRHRVTGQWGRQQHPTLQYVTTVNTGIDITCLDSHAQAVAVEPGVVSALYDQGDGSCIVMLRHGQYLSVYSGVRQPVVKKGQAVTSRQTLGEVALDPSTRHAVLHFELRDGSTALNPTLYIKGQ